MRKLFFASILAAALGLAACSDGESGTLPGAPDGVSDEDYLSALCTGAEQFSSALMAQSTPEALRAVITAYADELETIVPPKDVSRFHKDYIAFLRAAQEQPVLMANGSPPEPSEPARTRLASKEHSVKACKNPVFFAAPAKA